MLKGLDFETLKLKRFLSKHEHWTCGLDFSPEGKHLLSAANDGSLKLWNLETGEAEWTPMMVQNNMSSVAFSPDGFYVAVAGGEDHAIYVWDYPRRTLLRPLVGHVKPVTHLHFSSDGQYLISVGQEGVIRFWSLPLMRAAGPPLLGHTDAPRAVALSPDLRLFASVGKDNTLRLFEVATRRVLPCRGYTSNIVFLSFSPDGQRLVTTHHEDKCVVVWDTQTGEQMYKFETESRPNHAIFSPDGCFVAAGSWRHRVYIWRVQ